jgi:Co/Zn/Cd efflux system component
LGEDVRLQVAFDWVLVESVVDSKISIVVDSYCLKKSRPLCLLSFLLLLPATETKLSAQEVQGLL